MKNREIMLMMSLRIISGFCFIYFVCLVYLRGGAGFQWLWLGVGVISGFLSINPIRMWFFSNRWLNIFMVLCIIFFIGVEIVILVNSLDSKTKEDQDFLIVLGAGVRGTVPTLILKNRLEKTYEYLIQHEATIAVVTGGQGRGEEITEALAMKKYLIDRGIGEKRIIMEDQATDTSENMQYSFQIIDELKPNARIGIVTTRFHLFRSKLIAKQYGKVVEGYGAENHWPLIPHYYVREFFAVIKDFLH